MAIESLTQLGDNLKQLMGKDTAVDSNPLSYSHILEDVKRFRNQMDRDYVGAQFDDPGRFYFKVFFYFNNSHRDDGSDSNLLGVSMLPDLDWDWKSKGSGNQRHQYGANAPQIWNSYKGYGNTAFGYLMNIAQEERAQELMTFISLLSNISNETPWMIKEVSGLKDVLTGYFHPMAGFKIEEEPKVITLKMLQEPYDMRISTMLNAYRDAVVDRYRKLVVIPENLRKFDMGIYIFPAPYYHLNRMEHTAVGGLSASQNYYRTGSLYIELHDCEFDILNGFEAIDTLSNEEGNMLEYSINITVGQALLTNYNEFLDACFGDYFRAAPNPEHSLNNDQSVNTIYNFHKGILSKMFGQLMEKGKSKLNNFVKRVTLGNLYGLSPKNVWDNLTSGNVGLQSIGQVKKVMDNMGVRSLTKKGAVRNLYDKVEQGANNAIRTALDWDTNRRRGGRAGGKLSGYPATGNEFPGTPDNAAQNLFGFSVGQSEPETNPLKGAKLSGY